MHARPAADGQQPSFRGPRQNIRTELKAEMSNGLLRMAIAPQPRLLVQAFACLYRD